MSLIADCFRRLTDSSSCKSELKGYKVTDVNRTRKIGIACRNFQDLKRKACSKLNITNDPAEVNVFLLDGSLIDEEYFRTLEPQTTLIMQKPGEKVLSAPELNIPVQCQPLEVCELLGKAECCLRDVGSRLRSLTDKADTSEDAVQFFFFKDERFPADADILYDALKRVNIDFLTAGGRVTQFLTENLKAKVALLNRVLNKDESKTAFSMKDEHPEWFEDLETNCMTKEAYMHRRCQDRIRTYLYKTIEQIKCSDVFINDCKARQQLLRTIAFFKIQLKEDHYFGYYFDRSRAETDSKSDSDETDYGRCYEHCLCNFGRISNETYLLQRYLRLPQPSDTNATADPDKIDETDARKFLDSEKKAKTASDKKSESCPYHVRLRERQIAICNKKGEFKCEGRWNMDGCSYGDRHKINPYRSKEELALFSTWNLDHKIERSRTLIPKLLQISRRTINEQDIYDCYDNLFTVKNLRLVHIVCHDKGLHK